MIIHVHRQSLWEHPYTMGKLTILFAPSPHKQVLIFTWSCILLPVFPSGNPSLSLHLDSQRSLRGSPNLNRPGWQHQAVHSSSSHMTTEIEHNIQKGACIHNSSMMRHVNIILGAGRKCIFAYNGLAMPTSVKDHIPAQHHGPCAISTCIISIVLCLTM